MNVSPVNKIKHKTEHDTTVHKFEDLSLKAPCSPSPRKALKLLREFQISEEIKKTLTV